MSLRTWIATYLKSAAVGVTLTIGALIVMHASAWISADWWWPIAALSLGGAQLGVTMAVPSLLPLFASLRPLTRAALDARLDRLAKKAGGMTLPVYEWRDTTAARRAQAATVGLGRTHHLLLLGTLLEAFGEEEIEVIVAHELAHHVHRDLWTAALSRLATLIAGFWLADQWLTAVGAWQRRRQGLDRSRCAANDRHGCRRGHDDRRPTNPRALTSSRASSRSLLARSHVEPRRLRHRNAPHGRPQSRGGPAPARVSDLFFATHPPVTERIAAARALAPRARGSRQLRRIAQDAGVELHGFARIVPRSFNRTNGRRTRDAGRPTKSVDSRRWAPCCRVLELVPFVVLPCLLFVVVAARLHAGAVPRAFRLEMGDGCRCPDW